MVLLVAMHLFLVANIVTTSRALVSTSFLLLLVRHLLLVAMPFAPSSDGFQPNIRILKFGFSQSAALISFSLAHKARTARLNMIL